MLKRFVLNIHLDAHSRVRTHPSQFPRLILIYAIELIKHHQKYISAHRVGEEEDEDGVTFQANYVDVIGQSNIHSMAIDTGEHMQSLE